MKPQKPIATLDIVLLSVALLFTVLVLRAKMYGLVDKETQRQNFTILTLAVSYSLFLFQFRALRKIDVYMCWMILSLLLFVVFLIYCNDASLHYTNGNDATVRNSSHGLICPLLILIWYQLCRQCSLKFYGFELGMPGRGSSYIIKENRNATILDRVCTIGMFMIPAFSFVY